MGLRDFFHSIFGSSNQPSYPKEVAQVFEKVKRRMEGKRLAEDALSYRNLGNFEKTFALLKESLFTYKYEPAIALIATTFMMKNDIDKAKQWIEENLNHLNENTSYLEVELLANLGLIYFLKKEDFEKAKEVYQRALSIPKPEIMDDREFEILRSGVHRDLAGTYMCLGDRENAWKYAQLRLSVVPACEQALGIKSFLENAG